MELIEVCPIIIAPMSSVEEEGVEEEEAVCNGKMSANAAAKSVGGRPKTSDTMSHVKAGDAGDRP